jgi:3-hydroxyisobutyryl-CoA hydrolase
MRGLYDGYTGDMPKSYQPTFTGTLYQCDYALHTMKPIQICIWNGYVFGSGAGICMSSPFTVCCETTEWAMPECGAGILTDNAASLFFANLKGGRNKICLGLYLAITGARVKGRDLVKWGIASHYIPKS